MMVAMVGTVPTKKWDINGTPTYSLLMDKLMHVYAISASIRVWSAARNVRIYRYWQGCNQSNMRYIIDTTDEQKQASNWNAIPLTLLVGFQNHWQPSFNLWLLMVLISQMTIIPQHLKKITHSGTIANANQTLAFAQGNIQRSNGN